MPLLFGVTSAGVMVPVRVDTNGLIEIQSMGWVSSAWQKNPLAFGYSGVIARAWSNTSLPAGTSLQSDSAVPAGEIWVITDLTMRYDGTVANVNMKMHLTIGGVAYVIYESGTPVTTHVYDRQGWWILAPTDYLTAQILGATLNDDFYATATGFRVDIDQ